MSDLAVKLSEQRNQQSWCMRWMTKLLKNGRSRRSSWWNWDSQNVFLEADMKATIVVHKALVSLKNGGFVTMTAYSSGVIDTLGAASRSSSSSQLLFFIWVYLFRFRVVCAALTPYWFISSELLRFARSIANVNSRDWEPTRPIWRLKHIDFLV